MGKNNKGMLSDRYFQSVDFNNRTFWMYRDWILSLALSRFEWEGLPPTCDAIYLEKILLFEGKATIARKNGLWFSTQCVDDGIPNIYAYPTRWRSTGVNGWNFKVDNTNGVIVFDNHLRRPMLGDVEMFARRLAAIDRVQDINLHQQFNPYLITVPQERRNAAIQMYKQISSGEPAILGYSSLDDIKIQALDTKVPLIGEQLHTMRMNLWNQVYTYLGIDNLPTKSERMIEEEVASYDEPTELRALDPLSERRIAIRKLEGIDPSLEIFVHWSKDYRSKNWNDLHTIDIREEASDAE